MHVSYSFIFLSDPSIWLGQLDLLVFTLFAICLSFSSPPLLKCFAKTQKYFPFFVFLLVCLLGVVIMADFVVEKSEHGKTPKIETPMNLDAKNFVRGHRNIIGKNIIQEFFNCTGTLVSDGIPILKRTKNYVEAISTLVLKLERIIYSHPSYFAKIVL